MAQPRTIDKLSYPPPPPGGFGVQVDQELKGHRFTEISLQISAQAYFKRII